jgi:hypothetical protein
MRLALSIAAIAALFVTVLVGGGRLLGVWSEPVASPATSVAADRALGMLRAGPTAKTAVSKKTRRADPKSVRGVAVRWVQGTNALCRRARAETLLGVDEPKTLAEAEAAIAHLAELNRRYNARIRALPRPPDGRQREKIERLEKMLDEEESAIESLLSAIRHQDPVQMIALSDRLLALAERESALLVELGASDCAL